MSRAKWKGPFIQNTKNEKSDSKLKTVFRNSEITPNNINKIFSIHNGKNYLNLTVNENMITHKFGEFFFTRNHTIIKKKKWDKKQTR